VETGDQTAFGTPIAVRCAAQGGCMQERSSTENAGALVCRHEEYRQHLEELKQVPHDGSEAYCGDCGNKIEADEPVVHEDDEVICDRCHNSALAWATVMHMG
jgi:hypothetical protein